VLKGLTGDSRAAPLRSEILRPRISTRINQAPGEEARFIFIYAELHKPIRDTFDRVMLGVSIVEQGILSTGKTTFMPKSLASGLPT